MERCIGFCPAVPGLCIQATSAWVRTEPSRRSTVKSRVAVWLRGCMANRCRTGGGGCILPEVVVLFWVARGFYQRSSWDVLEPPQFVGHVGSQQISKKIDESAMRVSINNPYPGGECASPASKKMQKMRKNAQRKCAKSTFFWKKNTRKCSEFSRKCTKITKMQKKCPKNMQKMVPNMEV